MTNKAAFPQIAPLAFAAILVLFADSSWAQLPAQTVIATVAGQDITLEEIDELLGQKVASLQEQLYTLRRQKLDELIIAKLMAAEASARGVSAEELFQVEIESKVSRVTDADVAAFFAANKAALPANEEMLREQIRGYLTGHRLNERKNAFVQSLASAKTVLMSLAAPSPFRSVAKTEHAPFRGNAKALVSIVEFSDFHCPYCRQAQATLRQVLDHYADQVRLVFKHSPIDRLHPNARKASEASECARDQDQFWLFHDELFRAEPSESSSTDDLVNIAARLKLDATAFKICLESGKHASEVESDVVEGAALGVSGTPTFFVNGRIFVGAQSIDNFRSLIDQELALPADKNRKTSGQK